MERAFRGSGSTDKFLTGHVGLAILAIRNRVKRVHNGCYIWAASAWDAPSRPTSSLGTNTAHRCSSSSSAVANVVPHTHPTGDGSGHSRAARTFRADSGLGRYGRGGVADLR